MVGERVSKPDREPHWKTGRRAKEMKKTRSLADKGDDRSRDHIVFQIATDLHIDRIGDTVILMMVDCRFGQLKSIAGLDCQ